MTRILATLLALIMLTLTGYTAGYRRGVHIERQAHTAARAATLASALDRVAAAGQRMATLGEQLRDAIADSHERERVVVRTVTEVLRENPDFAAVRRPAELDRVRQSQLQAIADATAADMPR